MIDDWGRYMRGAVLGNIGFCTSWAVDHRGQGNEWIETVEVDLHIENLPKPFFGKRIVHVSDLHCGRTVSGKYLRRCVERINQLKADVVVLTGDYVTHDYRGRFREKVAEVVSGIESRHGIYACLGNHDYGLGGASGSKRNRPERMVEDLGASGVQVLRNGSAELEVDGERLWFVGVGDHWAGDFRPEEAFGDVEEEGAVIALVHNPEVVKYLQGFDADIVLSGHTHGAGYEWMAILSGAGIERREYYSGMYYVGGKKLYVNRGLGRVGKTFFNTRPEITVYNLG